ncbi:MAG TPA: hypothetical protein VKT28_04970 [Puia sp.]|nr:hypothetical protein [Puia sp.]
MRLAKFHIRKIFITFTSVNMIVFIACSCGGFKKNENNNKLMDSITTCAAPIKPNMYVKKEVSIKLEANFNLQHFELTKYSGIDETDSIFFPIDKFGAMIDYFHNQIANLKAIAVHFASYGNGGFCVPKGFNNKITLLFSPIDATGAEQGLFTITPSGTWDPNSDSCNLTTKRWRQHGGMDPDNDNNWIDNYNKNENSDILAYNLDPKDEWNFPDKDMNQDISDTRSITYSYSDLQQILIDEINYQNCLNPNNHVTGIRAFLASFNNAGAHYNNRLIIQFELTRKNNNNEDEVFYIDDQPGFNSRGPALKTMDKDWDKIRLLKGLDNGQLCPPYCQH